MTTDNVQLVRDSVEALNNQNFERFKEFATEDCVIHSTREDIPIDDYVEGWGTVDAISEQHIRIDEIFGADDRVVLRYTNLATLDGEYNGETVSKTDVSTPGIVISRIENGKIAEVWLVADISVRWEEAGVLPERFIA